MPSTSETSIRRFQCTVWGLAPAFSATDVATNSTESVRVAKGGNLVVTTGRALPGWVSRSWCTVSIATASIRPLLRVCNFSTTCR